MFLSSSFLGQILFLLYVASVRCIVEDDRRYLRETQFHYQDSQNTRRNLKNEEPVIVASTSLATSTAIAPGFTSWKDFVNLTNDGVMNPKVVAHYSIDFLYFFYLVIVFVFLFHRSPLPPPPVLQLKFSILT